MFFENSYCFYSMARANLRPKGEAECNKMARTALPKGSTLVIMLPTKPSTI